MKKVICVLMLLLISVFPLSDNLCLLSQTVYAAGKLDAPNNITYSSTADTIKLSWSEDTRADGYKILMYNEKTKKFEKYKNISGVSCTIKDLKKNTTYYFKIAALVKNKSGKYVEQTRSKQIKVTTKQSNYPAPPSKDYTGFATASGRKYYYEKGKAVSGWKKIDDSYYYFTDNGAVTGWLDNKGIYYYFNKDGQMYSNITLKIGDNKYEFGSDGKAKWYINTVEPKSVHTTISAKEPSIKCYVSNTADAESYWFPVGLHNYGDSEIIIAPIAELDDHDYSDYDRILGLFNVDTESGKVTYLKYQTIGADEYEDVAFATITDPTWWDRKSKIRFFIKYDGAWYQVTTSNYYGTTCSLLHFSLDSTLE